MSNKIVPTIYRSVIDDVIAAIRPAFEEFGLDNDVLDELQHKWETKVIASRVAEFDPGQPAHHPYPPPAAAAPAALPHYAPGVSYIPPSAASASASRPAPVKPDPGVDPRYAAYALPALPGPQLAFPGFPPSLQHAQLYRLPQTDGPSVSASDDSGDDESPGYAPRTAHPSLPQPKAKQDPGEDEAINSELDDSDTENEEDPDDAGPETDIVFCTYDKVARVKNKWKCVLKDGMIHTGGKDYLFQRCTGEFEW